MFKKKLFVFAGVLVMVCCICVGISHFMEQKRMEQVQQIEQGDVLIFGKSDSFDGQWLVLDAENTNMGTDGMFLASENLLGSQDGDTLLFRDIGDVSVSFADRGDAYAEAHPGTTDYQGSDIQKWCQSFFENNLSEEEQNALIATEKSDDAISIQAAISMNGKTPSVDFDAAENVLNGDKIFLLSAEEMTNKNYGFEENDSRVATYNGEAAGYYLRSPHSPSFPLDVGFVFANGAVMDFPVNARSMFSMKTYARVACNLDKSRIKKVELVSEADGHRVWNISFK